MWQIIAAQSGSDFTSTLGVVLGSIGTLGMLYLGWQARRTAKADAAAKRNRQAGDHDLRSDDAAWGRLQQMVTEQGATITRQEHTITKLQETVGAQHVSLMEMEGNLTVATAHASRCDAELAALRDRLDRGGTPP